MNAERVPLPPAGAAPAAVVPPGRGHGRPQLLGRWPVSASRRAEPEEGLGHEVGSNGAGKAQEHAGLGHGLDHQEKVGRPRPRHPGDGVEEVLGDLDHQCRPTP